jgi:hypothetical protein
MIGRLFNHDYTDEQLLNLINNIIIENTKFKIENFTGGSISVTSTYHNKFTNFKVTLFFGYDKNKNPIAKTLEIEENFLAIWIHAILLKTKSLKIDTIGLDQNDLIRKMTTKPNVSTTISTTGSNASVTESSIVNSIVDSNIVKVFDDDEKIIEVWQWILSLSQIGLTELLQDYIDFTYSNQKVTNPNALEYQIKTNIENQNKKTLLGIYDYMQRNWDKAQYFDTKDKAC